MKLFKFILKPFIEFYRARKAIRALDKEVLSEIERHRLPDKLVEDVLGTEK